MGRPTATTSCSSAKPVVARPVPRTTCAKVGVSIADIAAGMYAFSGTLAALYRRQATGEGASIEVSLFEALAEWVGQPAHFTAGAGRQPGRFGAQHATIAPYGPFEAGDGHTVLIAIQNEPEWSAVLHPCPTASGGRRGSAIRLEHTARGAPVRSQRCHHRGVRRTVDRRVGVTAGGRTNRLRGRQHRQRVSRPSGACRTGPVANGRHRERARGALLHRSTWAPRRAWARCPHSAITLRRF